MKPLNIMNSRTRATEIHVGKRILCLELAPYSWCSNLLAVATEDTILIYDLGFPEEDLTAFPDKYSFIENWAVGKNFNCGIISFSPRTNPSHSTRIVSIACADPSKSVFRYYGYGETDWMEFDHHQSFVNDIAIEPITGDVIASVGDDKTVFIISLDNHVMAEFHLKSPGISLSWHRGEEGKIIVGEKSGLITLYDFKKERAERSFDCHVFPLRCIKWCPSNSILIGGVTYDKWFIWNMNTSQPVEEGELTHKAASFRFSSIDENIFVVRSVGGTEIAIVYKNVTNIVLDDMPVGDALSFHAERNFFAIDGQEIVFIVKVYGNN